MSCSPVRYDWSSGYPRAIPSRMARMSRAARAALDSLVLGWVLLLLAGAIALLATGCGTGDTCDTTSHSQTLRLQPSAELADVVEGWAERWSAATGRAILVGTEGAPVTVDSYIASPEGAVLCGQTEVTLSKTTKQWISTQWMVVDTARRPECPPWGYIVGHEMGHALSACGHVDGEAPSLLDTALQHDGTQYVIDEAALTLVCKTSECTVFAPETL